MRCPPPRPSQSLWACHPNSRNSSKSLHRPLRILYNATHGHFLDSNPRILCIHSRADPRGRLDRIFGQRCCRHPTSTLCTIASIHETPADSSIASMTLTGPFCCNHHCSVTAITTSTGAIAERYAYTAYGQPTILNASGTPLSPQTSTFNSRYSYTGRQWDATLGLHHFRARWMSPSAGRFLGRDPIGYVDGYHVYRQYFGLTDTDPSGLSKVCCKFCYGYVFSQFTTKEVDCAQGKTANDCCRDYGAFPRLWAVEDSVDRPCKKSPNPVLLCDLKPVTTVKWVTTTTVTCGKPVVSIHPIVVVGTVLASANEWYIDHDPDINLTDIDDDGECW